VLCCPGRFVCLRGKFLNAIFSTQDVHPRDRFDFWHEIACRMILGHDARPDVTTGFFAELEGGASEGIEVVTHRSAAIAFKRTSKHVSASTSDDILLCHQLVGTSYFEDPARQTDLKPGGLMLLDPMRPYSGRLEDDTQLLVAKLPRVALEARIGAASSLSLLSIGGTPISGILVGVFGSLAQCEGTRDDHATVADRTLDLVASCLASAAKTDHLALSNRKAMMALRVREAVEARLSDSLLTPDAIAAAVGCTARYANMVLAEQGTSIGRLIFERRLERCRLTLADVRMHHRSITDIAFGWGFKNLAHFSRSFKDAYGLTPRDFRATSRKH
jgi:AraC family transcriptional regulator, positive regulator of tynA and feaB